VLGREKKRRPVKQTAFLREEKSRPKDTPRPSDIKNGVLLTLIESV
jgi:hypothetical protein